MRIVGWEERLAEIIKQADRQTYELGKHDCFTVACSVAKSLTGDDPIQRLAIPQYSTRADSIRLIRMMDEDVEVAISKVFNAKQIPKKLASRGDIGLFVDTLPHLCICVGPTFAVLLPTGLGLVKTSDTRIKSAWSIG